MTRERQNFLGLIIELMEEKEVLHVSENGDSYTWGYEKYDFTKNELETIHKEGILEKAFYTDAQKVLMNFKVQPYLIFGSTRPDSFSLDGVGYTLILGDSHKAQSRFTWRNKLPEEWAIFIPILDDLYKNLKIARQQPNTVSTFTE